MDPTKRLSRKQIFNAVEAIGWRYVLGGVTTCVRVASLSDGAEFATRAVATAGAELRVDLRNDRVVLALQDPATAWVTAHEIDRAKRIAALASEFGLRTSPALDDDRSVQLIEIAIDATDIPSVRRFWKAIMGYVDEANATDEDAIVDPWGQGPAIWFQQMGAPRPQRNRIHFDVSVPHDEAARRIDAAVAAGGVVLSDASAPAFWVLADPEGNEACVTTWQGRDHRNVERAPTRSRLCARSRGDRRPEAASRA